MPTKKTKAELLQLIEQLRTDLEKAHIDANTVMSSLDASKTQVRDLENKLTRLREEQSRTLQERDDARIRLREANAQLEKEKREVNDLKSLLDRRQNQLEEYHEKNNQLQLDLNHRKEMLVRQMEISGKVAEEVLRDTEYPNRS